MRVALTAQSKTRLAALRIRQLFPLQGANRNSALAGINSSYPRIETGFEWMARETLDLEPCSKSQTTRSVAARLGHDRQPGTPMHVFLCCHSKTAISLYSRTLRNRLPLLSSFHSHIFTSADNRF
jgi:hypothetical protein